MSSLYGKNRRENKHQNKQDRRVIKTKAAMRRAFTELLAEKPIRDIRVKELSERIHINRGTFYQYYRDIYDMQDHLEEELYNKFNEIFKDRPAPETFDDIKDRLLDIFTLLRQNADLTLALLGPNGDPKFVQSVQEMMRLRCINDLIRFNNEHSAEELSHDQLFNYSYAFIVSGCMGMMKKWLSEDPDKTPEEMVDIVSSVLMLGIENISVDQLKQKKTK
ncbi:TetR/AcrR family transcriptional regulator [Pseudoramibacter sp.]|jgi:AcrR family transcriptional regulator|uniref:TetR/AcrR family transcriptional regulator n=1 Tax=Pseudoramibacter sp. TaxID=2034862 RepID=UPI0025D267D6|nr:TetR-like C-terminal domain-containing protein [Pseudoramibacter sp.]MCH4072360.1 TetR family transcriptional regulator C-terminal domain-containing protein [Pseudoramibacter sp.]MCH4106131.1 TetR family transcriptional regulator C-terminal domain-containing protein [Pseudoramibacter sp.]